MRIFHEEYAHPTLAGVALSVFDQSPEGFLVTEERSNAVTVVSTLGLIESREAALARVRARAAELMEQRYRKAA